MTWIAVLVALVAAGMLGALTPRAIARLPEPKPLEPGEEYSGPRKADDAPPKPLYRDLASRPGIAARLAIASGLAAAVMALGTGWDWRLLPLVPLAAAGVALAYVDWTTQLLPNRLVYPALAVGAVLVLVAAALQGDGQIALRALYGGVGTFVVFYVLWLVYPRGMGYGDVRLSGLLGMALAQLGYAELAVGIYGAFLIGGVGGLLLSVFKVVSRKRMPFGPFMLVSAMLAVPFAEPTVSALLGV